MTNDPNFPVDLAISPLHHPQLSCIALTDVNQHVFGSSAQLESIRKYGIAGRVWEASYPLLLYLGHNEWNFDPPFAGRLGELQPMFTILELGAGTGIVTSKIIETVAVREQDVVISTDLPEVCSLLEANLKEILSRKACSTVRVRPLTWGNSDHAIEIGTELGLSMSAVNSHESRYLTHIVCSDLVYFQELLAPLLRTLIQLSSPPFISLPELVTPEHGLSVVMSYKIRSLAKETPFWSSFGLWFKFKPVIAMSSTCKGALWSRFQTSSDGHDFVFVARRRPESMAWRVPADDKDLLDGVGAWGTDIRKGDDTFETLLLMGLDDEEGK